MLTQFAAGRGECGGQSCVKGVPAQAEGGSRQLLDARRVAVNKPGDLPVRQGVVEMRTELQAGDGRGGKSRDKLTADAVAGIGAGLVEGDRYTLAAQGKPEGQAGQAAADDINGLE